MDWTDEERALIKRLKMPNEMSEEESLSWGDGLKYAMFSVADDPQEPAIVKE